MILARRLFPTSLPTILMLIVGCGRDAASPPKPVTSETTIETVKVDSEVLQKEIATQLTKQMELQEADLEKRQLILLIDGIRDEAHYAAIEEKAAKLLDKQGNYSMVTKGGPGGTTHIAISPITDVDKTIEKIDFGAVVAFDPDTRTLVINASSMPKPRPADGWPGSKGVQEFLGRKMASWAAKSADKSMLKSNGPMKTVVVAYPGSTSENPWADAIDDRLTKYGKDNKVEIHHVYTYAANREFRVATLGPVEDMAKLVKILGDDVSWADETHRAIVLERPKKAEK